MAVRFFSSLANSSLVSSSCLLNKDVFFIFVVLIVQDQVAFFSCGLARAVSGEVLKKYLEEKIYPKLEEKAFSVVYVHTDVQRSENFPGISTLRSIYDDIPMNVKGHLESVYFLHPGLQARLFLATFGRFLFSGG